MKAGRKRKGPRSGATARRPRDVVFGKPTPSNKPFDERLANARQFLDRRHRLGPWADSAEPTSVHKR